MFEDSRSGKPLSGTPGAEAERLARISRKADLSCPDKNEQHPLEMISQWELRRLRSFGTLGLVAGNVTGGGGKATSPKT